MEENTNIELSMDILEEQGSTSSSLGDIYGYFVFSEKFQEQILKKKEREKEEQQKQISNVFNNQAKDEVEIAFIQVMRAETNSIVTVAPMDTQSKEDNVFIVAGFILAGVLATTCVWLFIEKILRKGKKYANKNNHVQA